MAEEEMKEKTDPLKTESNQKKRQMMSAEAWETMLPNSGLAATERDHKRKGSRGSSEKAADEKEDSFTFHGSDSFTPEMVDELIQHASQEAQKMPRETPTGAKGISQPGHALVQQAIIHFKQQVGSQPLLAELGPVIGAVLQMVDEPCTRRPRSMSNKRCIFPLPTPEPLDDMVPAEEFLRTVVMALNSLHGCTAATKTNSASQRVLKRSAVLSYRSPW